MRENPQGLYMHTHFVALQKKSGKPQQAKKKPRNLQKTASFTRTVGTGNSGLRKVSEYVSRKKVWDHPGVFFAFLIKMQIFANVCGRPQPPSVSLWESLGAFLEVFGCLSGNL